MASISFVFECTKVKYWDHSAFLFNPTCGQIILDTDNYSSDKFIPGNKYLITFDATYCSLLPESERGFNNVEC